MSSQDPPATVYLTINADRKYVGDVSKAILSTVLFHRLFGTLQPSTSDAVGVTYPVVAEGEVAAVLNDRSKEVTQKFRDESIDTAHLTVCFFEKRLRKNAWFQKTHTVCWEKWNIELNTIDPTAKVPPQQINTNSKSPDLARLQTSRELRRTLLDAITNADENKDHIPAITTTSLVPFPYEINII